MRILRTNVFFFGLLFLCTICCFSDWLIEGMALGRWIPGEISMVDYADTLEMEIERYTNKSYNEHKFATCYV